MAAYEAMIRNTATRRAPWYVVPADNKWFTRVIVAAAIIDALASLDLAYPEVDKTKLQELAAARSMLEAEEPNIALPAVVLDVAAPLPQLEARPARLHRERPAWGSMRKNRLCSRIRIYLTLSSRGGSKWHSQIIESCNR